MSLSEKLRKFADEVQKLECKYAVCQVENRRLSKEASDRK